MTFQGELNKFQETAITIPLTDNIQGYLLAEKPQNTLQPLSSIMWEQDGSIYTASFREKKKQVPNLNCSIFTS